MKQINIREALLELDRKTDARYDLTTLYEACKLDDDDKQKLVKYIDAYDHPATINKFLSSKCDAITEALGDDDVSDMKLIDEINDGGDRTLWNLMDKFEDEDLQLKELKEDVDPEVLQSRLEDIEYAMNTYAKDSFFIDNVEGSSTDWKVTYNGTTVDVVFDTEWDEYTYTINGKGPYSHSSYEYITKDIMDFVDYGHLGQSDDEVDEALGDNRDIHTRTHMDSYDVYCTDCGQVTSHKFKGNFKDGEKELGRYICKECGCENDDDPINESLTEDVDTSNLEPQIKEVVNAFMAEVGYEADEIEAYTAVEIKDTDNDMIQVEVRAELGYDDLMELCDKLNPIVAAVDHLAYFEPVTSGIARAFIRNDQSQDIVDEEVVNQWTNKIYDCASMEDLRQVWRHFHDQMDNGQYTDGTVDAVLDVIHKKADMLNESLTEDAKEEYFVGDDETGRIYYNEKDAQAAFDGLKKSGIANPVKMKVTDMREGLTEDYNKGEWVEVNLNTKKNGTPNIIPVKVEKELYHGRTFLGWAWGERQHEYPMSAIVKKIDMDDTDAIIRKYTPSGYMSEKLTLNESDDTDILYDMEDWDEDNTTVTAGNQFIEDGYTWMWFKQCGDTVHLDFDNWAVWWAYRREDEDDEDSAAISGFFVVDTDTGFIDWGPCDTVKEAQEFLQSKVNDWENDDLDESKSIKESTESSSSYSEYLYSLFKPGTIWTLKTEFLYYTGKIMFLSFEAEKVFKNATQFVHYNSSHPDERYRNINIEFPRGTKFEAIGKQTIHSTYGGSYYGVLFKELSSGVQVEIPFGREHDDWFEEFPASESKSIKESAKIIRCRDCKTEFTSNDELDKAMYKGVPYYICSVCETPIKRIPKSELDPNNEIEYVIYESKSIREGHQVQTYKGYELDWNEDNIDPEEGVANFDVYITKDGKTITNNAFNGFRAARDYIDELSKKPGYYKKLFDELINKISIIEINNKRVSDNGFYIEGWADFSVSTPWAVKVEFDPETESWTIYASEPDKIENAHEAHASTGVGIDKLVRELYLNDIIEDVNESLTESKSIKEEFNIQDYYNQTLDKFNNIHSNINDDYDTFETGVELAIQDLTDEPNKSDLFRCDNREAVKTFTDKLVNARKYDTLRVYPEVRSGYYDVIDYLNRLVNESKSIKEAFKDLDTFTQHCIEFYCDSGAADNEADQYCSGNPSKWNITDPRFVDRAVEYYKESDYYDPDDWGHLDESVQDTVTRYQVEYFIDENDDSDTPLETYVYTDNKQEAIAKVKAEYPNAQIVYCVSETVPANYKEWDMKESIKEGVQAADEWYLKINPEDTEGAQELKGLFIDDVIKDKGNLDKYGFSDRLKGILDKEFERYSPMITEDVDSNLEAVANRLFNSLKEYGANKITKYVDVYQIYFNNSEDDSDATLVHYDIQSEGFKEVAQHGDEPNVTEYVNEDGTVCAKLLIYADAITVEVSAEDASQYMNVDESLKEGVEKYIIIAKEDGLNLYYNATDDNFGTDMKAATQYSERAVALDDYKAVKDRYPTAYIRSTYDIPLLNKPSKKEGFEEDEWDDDELASIYGGDTKYDMPDGVETPEETEARLAKENGR